MLKVEFKVTAAGQAIRRAAELLTDMTPIFADVAEYMVTATRKRFATSTDPDGNRWAPKKQSTLDHYKALGYGALPTPLIGPGKRLSREIVGQHTMKSATIGSALIYAGVMQRGAEKGAFGTNARGRPIPWGRIPARVWLGVGPQDEAAIIDIAEEHIEASLGGD